MYIDHCRYDTHVGSDLVHMHGLKEFKFKLKTLNQIIIKTERSSLNYYILSADLNHKKKIECAHVLYVLYG